MKAIVAIVIVLVVAYFGYQSVTKTIDEHSVKQAELQEHSVVTQLQNNINSRVPTVIKLKEACVTINGTDFKFFSPVKVVAQSGDFDRDIVVIDSSGNLTANQMSSMVDGNDWVLFQINDGKAMANLVVDVGNRLVAMKPATRE